jgi:hypothetical protein
MVPPSFGLNQLLIVRLIGTKRAEELYHQIILGTELFLIYFQ